MAHGSRWFQITQVRATARDIPNWIRVANKSPGYSGHFLESQHEWTLLRRRRILDQDGLRAQRV
jgi:hypothetical protein